LTTKFRQFMANMEQEFKGSPDHFKRVIQPAIFRRTYIGIAIVVGCIIWWLSTHTWLPIVLIAIVLLERLYELSSIRNTKEIVSSQNVAVDNNGLIMSNDRLKAKLFFPWLTLKYKSKKDSNGIVESIEIEDSAVSSSKLKIIGLEDMNGLEKLIIQNTDGK